MTPFLGVLAVTGMVLGYIALYWAWKHVFVERPDARAAREAEEAAVLEQVRGGAFRTIDRSAELQALDQRPLHAPGVGHRQRRP
ncbi:MAG TPA: hypothetical protein VHX88_12830 [Solirubrobacteraceae bacterium]|nr:hypothetical protein [Solirubrobacteraceae bacterium]